MLLFAIFTLGYFAGVFTALAIFPPKTTELEHQEMDAARPIQESAEKVSVTGSQFPVSRDKLPASGDWRLATDN